MEDYDFKEEKEELEKEFNKNSTLLGLINGQEQQGPIYEPVLQATAIIYKHELEKIKALPTYREKADAIHQWASAKAAQLKVTLQILMNEKLDIPEWLPESEQEQLLNEIKDRAEAK